ncbi:hypothetical protein [Natronococcus occultus]|uniref:Uncharacterized protein n=1 Tax=Natronococcus occultus SP4 TaxID=694430 RepID=L0JUQ6_9EURY|nr:hypothetical protein [Natronococcus occultus]AGB36757.1 hypothetical protein Natoc_0908 [Natronococcus occultus SP4]
MGGTLRDMGDRTTPAECAAIESRLPASVRTGSDRDREHVYWHVVLSLRRWINGTEDVSEATVERQLRRSIRRDLRRLGHPSAAGSITRPKETDYCDVVVDERIGLKVVHNLTSRSREWMHKQLRSLLREYDYLILYGHGISPETIDVWRQLKRTLTRAASDERRFHAIGTIRWGKHRTATEPAVSRARRWSVALGPVTVVGAVTATFAAAGTVGAEAPIAVVVLGSAATAVFVALLASRFVDRSS